MIWPPLETKQSSLVNACSGNSFGKGPWLPRYPHPACKCCLPAPSRVVCVCCSFSTPSLTPAYLRWSGNVFTATHTLLINALELSPLAAKILPWRWKP